MNPVGRKREGGHANWLNRGRDPKTQEQETLEWFWGKASSPKTTGRENDKKEGTPKTNFVKWADLVGGVRTWGGNYLGGGKKKRHQNTGS